MFNYEIIKFNKKKSRYFLFPPPLSLLSLSLTTRIIRLRKNSHNAVSKLKRTVAISREIELKLRN